MKNRFDWDDDYSSRTHYTKKKKFKGHQSKIRRRDLYIEEAEDYEENTSLSYTSITSKSQPTTSRPTSTRPTTDTTTYVQEIKGSSIDFARLADIQKIEQEHNGHITYGIKFLFKGKKGLFRIVWFNRDQDTRDTIFNEKVSYWQHVEGLL